MSLTDNKNNLMNVISSLETKTAGVFDAGKDAMWDYLQDYGNKKDYRYAFFYTGFSHVDPKYPINAANSDGMMANMSNLESVNWSKFNLSATSSLYNAFGFCYKLTAIDTDLGINNSVNTALNSMCRNCNSLTRIQKIKAYPAAVWKQSFENCTALTHVIFDGTIGANGLDLHWSTGLDKESIESIIGVLSDTTSGLSITLSRAAVDTAFGDGTEFSGTDGPEWGELIETKSNWTINLV